MMFYSLKKSAVLAALLFASASLTSTDATSVLRGAADKVAAENEEVRKLSSPKEHSKHAHHSPPKNRQHTPPSGTKKKRKEHTPPSGTKTHHHSHSPLTPVDKDAGEAHGRHLNEWQSRIVGGGNAPAGAYKFMVNWADSCGGSLIAPNMVLTAAHCEGVGSDVRIGSDFLSTGGVTRQVSNSCKHPNYNDATTDNDYLILELSQPVDTNTYAPIQLNSDANLPLVDDMLTVIGFGATTEGGSGSERLLQVNVPTNSHATCQSQYAGVQQDIHLCAGFTQGGKDSCQGDSGGPIFEMRNGAPTQVGVVSFGNGCAQPNNSGVYARVSGAYDWIQETMSSLQAGNGCGNGGDGGGGGGGGGGVDPNCENDPAGWHDSDGPDFDCSWYAEGNNCNDYGNEFANPNFGGKTAKAACCVCGGGKDTGGGPSPVAPPVAPPVSSPVASPVAPVPSPVAPPVAPPVASPGNCQSTPNWHDSDGTEFDCEWYSEGSNCQDFGSDFAFNGKTAKQACCECGGGSTGGGGGGGGGTCSDSPSNWHDADGSDFDCDWYARGRRCENFGDLFSNFGKTAQEACCACGGGN